MTKTKIIFVRHGRTDYNEKGFYDGKGKAKLTDEGKNQAKKIAEIFENENITSIYSSPLQRCIDTITPIANKKGLEVITKDSLIEIQSPDLQDKEFSCKNYKWDNGFGGGEKVKDVYQRVSNQIDQLIKNHSGETIIVCSHGDPSFLAINHFHGFDYDTEKYSCGLYMENNPEKYEIDAMYGIEEI